MAEANEILPDAMRVTPDGQTRRHEDRCEGECHEVGYDWCNRCCSLDIDLVCLSCLDYMMDDAR